MTAPEFNGYSVTLLLGFIQGVVYFILLTTRGILNEQKSDVLLGLLLSAMCVEILPYMLGFMGVHVLWEELYFFPQHMGLLIGPLFYFYILSQTADDSRLFKRFLPHSIPFFLFTGYRIAIFSLGREFVIEWDQQVHRYYHIGIIEDVMTFISNCAYLSLSLMHYRHFKRFSPQSFSNLAPVSFTWFRNLTILFFVGIIVNWGMELTDLLLDLDYRQDWWNKVLTVVFIYYLSIAGYNQIKPKEKVQNLINKTRHEELSAEDLDGMVQRIKKIMEVERLYLQSELTLGEMAGHLHTNAGRLSYAINSVWNKSFNEFVNEYRVNEVIHRLKMGDHKTFTLLGIAFESGFNSKSTFNRAFKKSTGKTPADYSKGLSLSDS